MEKRFQSISKDLRDDFVGNITKTNGLKLMSKVRATSLWNDGKKGMVQVSRKVVIIEEVPNKI